MGVQPTRAQTQTPSGVIISIDVKNQPIDKVFSLIEKQTSFRFAYNTALIQSLKNITYSASSVSLSALLNTLFHDSNISYSIIGNQIVLQKISLANKITINGYIRDGKTGELLIGAGIYVPGNKTGTLSNNYGFYAITLPQTGQLEIQVSYIGYRTVAKKITAGDNATLNIDLEQYPATINNVTVTDDKRDDNIKLNQLGITDISADMLADAPSVSGDGDIIHAVQMQPGVQAGLEGTPGFFVRGGNAGQNLVQLDEATLYNPSHLFDLVGIFNATAIKKATLLKGGFPASYGDYLSSVLDISMKDGNNKQFGGIVQAGNIVSGITLYGPISKNKASFMIAARRSMIDLLLQPFNVRNYFSNYAFYDVNAKLSWQFSKKNRVFLSFYKGQDKNIFHDAVTLTDSNGIVYTDTTSALTYGNKFGNQAFTFRWNHLFSRKLFSNTSVIYNNYYQSLTAIQNEYFAQLYSGIRDINIKTDLYYYPGQTHKIKGGINFLHQQLFPAVVSDKISPTGAITDIKPDSIPEKISNRIAAYLSDDINVSNKLNIYAGVRVPVFYTPNVQYIDVEPRVSLRYLLDATTSIKATYTQMHQYIHLVQSYNASFPAEIWIGSSNMVKPQFSQQFSAGLFKNFANNTFQASLECYYKLMDNQLLFKGGTEATIDYNLEDNLIFGKGRNYGAEFFIRKKKGRLTGWAAYSLAYAYLQFDSLNLGQEFPFAYDRRNSIYLSSSYAINNHWKVSANFFAASGRVFTIKNIKSTDPNPIYQQDDGNGSGTGNPPDIEVNNYRLTPYDRLDLGISYKKTKQTSHRITESEWSLSIYNVYAQNNISLAYRAIDPVTKQAVVKEVSFIPVIPTITYHYKF
ncbi:MAG: TonB-dependent receptor [Sediminibacterium sp.]